MLAVDEPHEALDEFYFSDAQMAIYPLGRLRQPQWNRMEQWNTRLPKLDAAT